jgi:hypothetical protein
MRSAQYPEIRARLAAMTQPQRMAAINADIVAGRDELAGAVLSAPRRRHSMHKSPHRASVQLEFRQLYQAVIGRCP